MPTSLGETTSVYVPPQRIRAESADGDRAGSGLWDKDGFSFGDLLDVINPLQHIPIISNLYRSITGDDIGQLPKVIGGALFGGAIGLVASLFNAIIEEETGKDVGEHAIAVLFGDDEADSPPGDTPNNVIVAAASAFSPANDAIFYDEAAPARPVRDMPPIMLAAAVTPTNDSEFAGAVVPAALPPAPRPALPAKVARAAVPERPAAKPVPPRPATAPAIPAATPANGEAGDEPAEIDAEQHARAALLSHFGGGIEAATRPGPWISQAMMYGLDRYQAMARERMRAKPDIDSVF